VESIAARAVPEAAADRPAHRDGLPLATATGTIAATENVDADGFRFRAVHVGDDGRRATLVVDTPFGRPNTAAKIELARHSLSLPTEMLAPVPVPIQRAYDFEVPALPVVAQAQASVMKPRLNNGRDVLRALLLVFAPSTLRP